MILIKSLKALADEKRLKILQMLMASDLCVGALAKHLGISKPAVSQHLQILRKAGLVRGEKRGYWTHYVVNRHALSQIASKLNDIAVTENTHITICRRTNEIHENKPESEEADICKNCCQQPDKLMDKPENYAEEQMRECHSDTKKHPCTKENCDPEHREREFK